MQARKAWDSIVKILKLKLAGSEFGSWFLNVEPISIKDNLLLVAVDNEFLKSKLKEYELDIKEILNDIFIDSNVNGIKIEVRESSKDLSRNLVKPDKRTKYRKRENEDKDGILFRTNKKYVFRNFIVGKSNDFAHAAALGVANSPGKVYNPLFLYGGVGLGKTHLMNAIGNKILENNKDAKVYYCSSEQFTNDLINSLKQEKMHQFREKYRKLDVLLIDDIQFIAGKERTQEEIFYTLNTLHQYSRQIVISSDRPPHEMRNIEERLVSRFAWGLIADIKTPDYETKVAILKNKAEEEGIEIPEDAIKYIAESIDSNIRELEGSLNRIVAKASLLNREIDFDLIQNVFKGFREDRARKVTKSKLIRLVSEHYSVPIKDMESNKRKKEITRARQVSMYLLRTMLSLSFASIGEMFGGRDHTTVMHSVDKIDSEIAHNPNVLADIEEIKRAIFK